MGVSSSITKQSVKQTQKVSDDILQVSNQSCKANCTSDFSNNTVIIENLDIGGNLDLYAICEVTGFECTLNSYLDTDISTILKSMAEQKSSATDGIGFNF